MPRLDTGLPHLLIYRRRFHRLWRLAGCAMLLGGAVLASAPWLLPEASRSSSGGRILALSGAAAAAIGAVLLFGRRIKRFDKSEGTLCVGWGVIVPWRQAIYDLPSIQLVLLGPADGGEKSRWQVVLQGAAGERLMLFELPRESTARAAADEIAAFLGRPVSALTAPLPLPSSDDGAEAQKLQPVRIVHTGRNP